MPRPEDAGAPGAIRTGLMRRFDLALPPPVLACTAPFALEFQFGRWGEGGPKGGPAGRPAAEPSAFFRGVILLRKWSSMCSLSAGGGGVMAVLPVVFTPVVFPTDLRDAGAASRGGWSV